MSTAPSSLLILGLGNVLCGDDGLGVAALAELERGFEVPESVTLLDGGTLGLALLHYVRDSGVAIFVDAIRADEAAGTLVRLVGDDVAPAVESRLSVHQIGVADLLDGLRWSDRRPTEIVLLGLVPETVELGLGLSPTVARALPSLVEAILDETRRLGFGLRPRRDEEDARARHESRLTPRALGL